MTTFYLWGMPGSGKTTALNYFERHSDAFILDLDQEIAKVQGIPIPAIFEQYGEKYFRDLEAATLRSLPLKETTVIAVGGGTPCYRNNANWMIKHGICIFIDTPLDTIASRIQANFDERPLFSGVDQVNILTKAIQLRTDRLSYYSKAQYSIAANESVALLPSIFAIYKTYRHNSPLL